MDLYGALGAAILVALAFVVPHLADDRWRDSLYAAAAPIFGSWEPHWGWGTGPAIAIGVLVTVYGPGLAGRMSWRWLLPAVWLTALAWSFALAMVDGWQRGFAGRLTTGHEYLHEVGGVSSIGAMLRGFADRILDFQPDSWTTHVSGHPPGALLTFVLLDRAGLGGGTWAALVCTAVGCSAAVAVVVAIRALGAPERARAVAPFLALAPAAIWLAVSADALFTGVSAWAVALLALAVEPGRRRPAVAFGAGILFGYSVYLNYGLILMAIPAAAVLMLRGVRGAWPAAVGALTVVALFTLSGFWWLDGYHLVVERYYQGIATTRPASYWVWGNLAATVCAVGLASAAGATRLSGNLGLPRSPRFSGSAAAALRDWRGRVDPAALMAAAGLLALLVADISLLSKAETERIWLPFDIWVLACTALLPVRTARRWLAVQVVGTLLIAHLILTNW
ncbi:hypothetical protein BOX37_13660 [Nocardia mangyaensis]|uniref:Integral membrane protein n=1 Tax=Nocardia mangyaensis TaxID=2213200 RepID=A0A1J0W218_9NOCA|nr:hypothetical protein BOX37_13660 [Nocardia mangyaensis]